MLTTVPGHFAERHFAERHFAERHFAERIFYRTDISSNGHFAERTFCQLSRESLAVHNCA
jgi:hypothetical protein